MKYFWSKRGDAYFLQERGVEIEKLENAVYQVNSSLGGPFLTKISDKFAFDYKVYGIERGFINRVKKTYKETKTGNLGVLLNGLKGTGKTVTSKLLSNELDLPIIIVTGEGFTEYLNSIPQDILIFIDEYEKVFEDSHEMLTIMDGALNSEYRRMFVLTSNSLDIEQNLIQRPGRIRYLKKFIDLKPQVVEQIVDDLLKHKNLRDQSLRFIATLQIITVDIVKAVIQEVNIHKEDPAAFADVFNVQKLSGKFDVSMKVRNRYNDVETNVSTYPRIPFDEYNENDWFKIDGTHIGVITKVLEPNVIEVSPDKNNRNKPKWLKKATIIKIDEAITYHKNYSLKSALAV